MISVDTLAKTKTNTDLVKVVIHHTDNSIDVTGEDINSVYIRSSSFGVPYDIMVNQSGSIDLPARWIFTGNAADYSKDVPANSIFTYYKHRISNIGNIEYRIAALNIGVVGNFDIFKPTPYQFNSLALILKAYTKMSGISLVDALLFQSDISTESSPGSLFFSKADLITAVGDDPH